MQTPAIYTYFEVRPGTRGELAYSVCMQHLWQQFHINGSILVIVMMNN